MKAAVCYAHGEPLAIQEVSIADPGPGEVKVRLAACAICHSDISYADGAWGGELPEQPYTPRDTAWKYNLVPGIF